MKKTILTGWIITLLLGGCAFALSGCGAKGGGDDTKSSAVDLDLTKLSSTMVYSEVYNMMMEPEEYIGKTIRMDGVFSVYHDPRTEETYYSCIIADATACCAQGIEFVWAGEHSYPDDYPESDSEIEVVGHFERYEEDGIVYYHIEDAKLDRI